jgi:hypothetical protein
MKKIALLGLTFMAITAAFAQVGFKKKKEDIEKFKDTRLVVVLSPDSAYNVSIIEAVEKYWTFNGGFLFEYDSAMKPYNKPEYSYLYFSKSKGTKIKAKLGTCEFDFNGLLITTGGKFKKKALEIDLVAGAFCSNFIDTNDWRPELSRAVQMLNNYLTNALEAEGDKGISTNYMANNAPLNSSLLEQTLMLPLRSLELKGKEDAATLWGGEVEDVEVGETYNAIMNRADKIIFFYSKDENRCNKIVTSTTGELVYLAEDSPDKCRLTAKDLKAMNVKRTRATK